MGHVVEAAKDVSGREIRSEDSIEMHVAACLGLLDTRARRERRYRRPPGLVSRRSRAMRRAALERCREQELATLVRWGQQGQPANMPGSVRGGNEDSRGAD